MDGIDKEIAEHEEEIEKLEAQKHKLNRELCDIECQIDELKASIKMLRTHDIPEREEEE